MAHANAALLRQLARNSAPYRDPLELVDWEALAHGGEWLPESACSLYGLPEYGALAPEARSRLARYEFVNTLCCGLWLEGAFLRRLAGRLHARLPRAERLYLLHELREEAGHSLMFLAAIEASGLELPEGAWRAPRIADLAARLAPVSGALFWLAALIAEEVPDRFNRWLRSHGAALNRAVRQICTLHAQDEARHVAAARERLERALAAGGAWRRAALEPAANLILRGLADAFFLPPAAFYELAGLADGRRWRRLAARNPAHRAFLRGCLAPILRTLEGYGFAVRI
jgi:hypothetical protein